jgi:hypothetical protein
MEQERDTQSRKWQPTINNPVEHGLGHALFGAVIFGAVPFVLTVWFIIYLTHYRL